MRRREFPAGLSSAVAWPLAARAQLHGREPRAAHHLGAGATLPTISANRAWLETGALMSFGVNYPNMFRRSAGIVDKILRGPNPVDIPIEQPTKFELVVNRIVAKALGLTIPPNLLAVADEVIE